MAVAIQCLSCARFLTVGPTRSFPLQRKPLLFSLTLSSRSRNLSSSIFTASSKNKNKKKLSHVTKRNEEEEEEVDAFELLFKQLEEDLKKDADLAKDDGGDDDEITEEEMDMLESELADVLGDFDSELLNSDINETQDENVVEKSSGDGNENLLNLRTWQLNKLARALKTGRRKTSIKTLAAELCLDRALVLALLRNPPPNLLMLSLTIPDEPKPSAIALETPGDTFYKETSADNAESKPKSNLPIHTMQQSWSARKRLKKTQLDTLERVYRRSKRPTNAMISNIVHVTNIPRKIVIKWFEDKRAEEGVPENHIPYQRSAQETC